MPRPREVAGIRYAVMLAGSQTELARELGVSNAVVSEWVRKGYVPNKRVNQIHKLYGIARSRLCNPELLEFISDEEDS